MLFKLILVFAIAGSTRLQTSDCLLAFCETCSFIQTSTDGFKSVESCFKCAPYYKLVDSEEEESSSAAQNVRSVQNLGSQGTAQKVQNVESDGSEQIEGSQGSSVGYGDQSSNAKGEENDSRGHIGDRGAGNSSQNNDQNNIVSGSVNNRKLSENSKNHRNLVGNRRNCKNAKNIKKKRNSKDSRNSRNLTEDSGESQSSNSSGSSSNLNSSTNTTNSNSTTSYSTPQICVPTFKTHYCPTPNCHACSIDDQLQCIACDSGHYLTWVKGAPYPACQSYGALVSFTALFLGLLPVGIYGVILGVRKIRMKRAAKKRETKKIDTERKNLKEGEQNNDSIEKDEKEGGFSNNSIDNSNEDEQSIPLEREINQQSFINRKKHLRINLGNNVDSSNKAKEKFEKSGTSSLLSKKQKYGILKQSPSKFHPYRNSGNFDVYESSSKNLESIENSKNQKSFSQFKTNRSINFNPGNIFSENRQNTSTKVKNSAHLRNPRKSSSGRKRHRVTIISPPKYKLQKNVEKPKHFPNLKHFQRFESNLSDLDSIKMEDLDFKQQKKKLQYAAAYSPFIMKGDSGNDTGSRMFNFDKHSSGASKSRFASRNNSNSNSIQNLGRSRSIFNRMNPFPENAPNEENKDSHYLNQAPFQSKSPISIPKSANLSDLPEYQSSLYGRLKHGVSIENNIQNSTDKQSIDNNVDESIDRSAGYDSPSFRSKIKSNFRSRSRSKTRKSKFGSIDTWAQQLYPSRNNVDLPQNGNVSRNISPTKKKRSPKANRKNLSSGKSSNKKTPVYKLRLNLGLKKSEENIQNEKHDEESGGNTGMRRVNPFQFGETNLQFS